MSSPQTTHVVLFKLKDRDQAAAVAERLMAMAGQVPTLRAIEAGVDHSASPRSFDVALITRFDDQAGLEAYRVHPKHQEVVEFIKLHADSSAVVDFD